MYIEDIGKSTSEGSKKKRKRQRPRERYRNSASGLEIYRKKKKKRKGKLPEIVPEEPGIISGKALADNLRKNDYIYEYVRSTAFLKLKAARENLPIVNPDTGEVIRVLLPYKRLPRKAQYVLENVTSDEKLGKYSNRSTANWAILQQLAARNFTADEVALVIATNPYLASHYIPSKPLRRAVREKGHIEAFLDCNWYIRQVTSDYLRALKKRFKKGDPVSPHDQLDLNVHKVYELSVLLPDIMKTLELDGHKHALKQSALTKVLIELASRVYPFNNDIPKNLSEIGLHAGVDRKSARACLRRLEKLGIIHTTEKTVTETVGRGKAKVERKRPIYFVSVDFDRVNSLLSSYFSRLEEFGLKRPNVDTMLTAILLHGAAATKRRGTMASRKEVYRERIIRQLIARAEDMSIFSLSPQEFQVRFNVSARTARRYIAMLKEYFGDAQTPEDVLAILLDAEKKAVQEVYRTSAITIQLSFAYRLYFKRDYKRTDVDRIWSIIQSSRLVVPDPPEESYPVY
jgi:hypothetical protein